MREIKFRIWDKDKKKFLTNTDHKEFMIDTQGQVYSINGFFDNAKVDEYSGIAIQQYTELKDKDGKEIYEGDIVKIDDNELYKITFKSGAFRATPLNKEALSRFCSDSGIIFVYLCRDDNVEVIGNIYENKELLK